jgi:hypothetical protein
MWTSLSELRASDRRARTLVCIQPKDSEGSRRVVMRLIANLEGCIAAERAQGGLEIASGELARGASKYTPS